MQKVQGLDVYTWKESRYVSFTYRPKDGLVKAANSVSTLRAVEYFAYKQYRIDWEKSNPSQGILQVNTPEHLTSEQEVELISTSLDEMEATSLNAATKAKEELLLLNVDNTTGKSIKESYLHDTMGRINKAANKTREDVCNWFNHYNLEEIRPDAPLLIVSTKSKKIIIDEGRALVWKLFEQGKLRKLTKEEFKIKMTPTTVTS